MNDTKQLANQIVSLVKMEASMRADSKAARGHTKASFTRMANDLQTRIIQLREILERQEAEERNAAVTVQVNSKKLSDQSEVFAIEIVNGGERVTIDAINEKQAIYAQAEIRRAIWTAMGIC